MKNLSGKTIGEIVADDYRTAAIFSSYGIDFCCKGNRTVKEVCEKRNIEPKKLIEELEATTLQNADETIDYQSWPADKLADHIITKHHGYVEQQIPVIRQYLDKICKVHGKHHPELFQIAQLFNESSGELAMHMKKEELILFPFIRQMLKAKENNTNLPQAHFGTVANPIQMMMQEHDTEGDRFREISKLSNHYQPPESACNTYRVTYALLDEFEQDLHLHIHLENNILFPKAKDLEEQLTVVQG